MGMKTHEIDESKIAEAVKFAISNNFNLGDLSRLLVMEGGVDLDTLARIIAENQPVDTPKPFRLQRRDEIKPMLNRVSSRSSEYQMPVDPWFGLNVAT